jgi:hypothetical protein
VLRLQLQRFLWRAGLFRWMVKVCHVLISLTFFFWWVSGLAGGTKDVSDYGVHELVI